METALILFEKEKDTILVPCLASNINKRTREHDTDAEKSWCTNKQSVTVIRFAFSSIYNAFQINSIFMQIAGLIRHTPYGSIEGKGINQYVRSCAGIESFHNLDNLIGFLHELEEIGVVIESIEKKYQVTKEKEFRESEIYFAHYEDATQTELPTNCLNEIQITAIIDNIIASLIKNESS